MAAGPRRRRARRAAYASRPHGHEVTRRDTAVTSYFRYPSPRGDTPRGIREATAWLGYKRRIQEVMLTRTETEAYTRAGAACPSLVRDSDERRRAPLAGAAGSPGPRVGGEEHAAARACLACRVSLGLGERRAARGTRRCMPALERAGQRPRGAGRSGTLKSRHTAACRSMQPHTAAAYSRIRLETRRALERRPTRRGRGAPCFSVSLSLCLSVSFWRGRWEPYRSAA
jgi:hypothetical protein